MSILSSQSLWATDVRALQDTTEFQHGLPVCFLALDLVRAPALMPHVQLVKQGLEARFHHQTFVTCLSTRNDLKSQWEEYAENQSGFAISFDSLVLSALESPQGYRLMPVEYGLAAQKRRAEEAVSRALHDIEAATAGQPHDVALFAIQSRFVFLATELFHLCVSFKASTYAPEHEWRLIYSCPPGEAGSLKINRRSARGKDVAYVSIDLRRRYAQHTLPSFAAVRAGPETEDNTALLVQQYLHSHAKGTTWERQPRF
jgi:hypothetical protein